MKTSSFIKWQIKKWLPMFIVLFIIPAAFTWIEATLRDLYINGGYSNFNTGTGMIYWTTLIPSFVLPFFVYSERFSKKAADAYKAFPANPNQINRVKIIIAAIYIVALITVITWSSVGIVGYRYLRSAAEVHIGGYHEYTYVKYDVNFLGYIPAYLFILGGAIVTFLFNCTLVSLGNNVTTSFIYLSAGTIAICCLNESTTILIELLFNTTSKTNEVIEQFAFNGGFVGRSVFLSSVINPLISFEDPYIELTGFIITTIVILNVVELGVGLLSFFIKDGSGEYFGMPGSRKPKHKIIVYISMIIVFNFIIILMGEFIGLSHLLYINLLAVYSYVLLVIFNKKFKLPLNDVIFIAGLFVTLLILRLVVISNFTEVNIY